MNKFYLFTIVLLSAIHISAQDLASKIPKEVYAVASLKGENLTELFPIEEFDKTTPGKEIIKEVSRKGKIHSIAELGVDIASTGYYFYQVTDSIRYHCSLIPINDVNQFESLIHESENIKEIKGVKAFYKNHDKNSVIAWNDQMMLFVHGQISKSYFSNNEVRKRYNLSIKENGDKESPVEYRSYEIFENRSQKREIAFQFIESKIDQIFNKPFSQQQSIFSNADYTKSRDKNAEFSIWISDIMEIYSDILKEADMGRYSELFYNGMNPAKFGTQGLSGHLYAEKDELKASIVYHMDNKMAARMKKVYSGSLNKKFLKYISEEEILGYASYAIDTEKFLVEYPKMVKNSLGGLFETEADIITNLISVILDEKAIGKVIKGDALFLMYDLSDKEVTYKTYEYDEDYKYTEVEKTKTETIPDFLLLLSSDDTSLLKKILKFSQEKGFASYKNGIYTITHREFPTEIYAKIENGIISIGTSLERIKKAGNTPVKISKKHRQILQKSSSSIYINTKEVVGIAKNFERSNRGKKKLDYVFNNVEDIQLTTSKIKNNNMTLELKMGVPTGHANGLKYLITLLEEIDK
ncbi:hypothetical protein [Aquimarina sediminis]|uniref:hypothetical protein n=1 Tax=Aquimarina sediminis TaxID=2070536 RepID=UPI000CA0830B|nr:hypothetical protein [Aquimarina sediminis]